MPAQPSRGRPSSEEAMKISKRTTVTLMRRRVGVSAASSPPEQLAFDFSLPGSRDPNPSSHPSERLRGRILPERGSAAPVDSSLKAGAALGQSPKVTSEAMRDWARKWGIEPERWTAKPENQQ